ncbi:MAG: hypothetical protein ABEI86_01220 [Halobacteriaceae archaeon]
MSGRTPTIDTRWDDLTTVHKQRRETVEKHLRYFPNKRIQATYVIGAIGAGKTQLMMHAFRYAWAHENKPALYVTLGKLIDDLEDQVDVSPSEGNPISQQRLYEWMEDRCQDELDTIGAKIEQDEEFDRDQYLPNVRSFPNPQEYFEQIEENYDGDNFDYEQLTIDSENLLNITDKEDSIILLIDEMEESYPRLEDLIDETTGPLREVVTHIDNQESPFYLIGAFGYASVQELGHAEFRRVIPVSLPILRPDRIGELFDEDLGYREENFAWWMSRGRPGWVDIALQNQSDTLSSGIDGIDDRLREIPDPMSRVSLIDLNSMNQSLNNFSNEARDLVSYLLLQPGPHHIDEFNDAEKIRECLRAEAPPVLCAPETTGVDDIYSSFFTGLKNMTFYTDSLSSDIIRRYARRVLTGVADSEEEIVAGHAIVPTFRQGKRTHELVLSPLCERMHDIALEELNEEDEQESETLDFLYELAQTTRSTPAEEISQDFASMFDQFTKYDRNTIDEEMYLSVSPETLITAFPSFVTNPQLNFGGSARNREKQFAELIDTLNRISEADERLKDFGKILQEDPR